MLVVKLLNAGDRERLLLELSKGLLRIGSIRIGSFTTQEGRSTPYFLDLKRAVSFPDVMSIIKECMKSKLNASLQFSCICGIPISGLVYSALIANDYQKPLVYLAGQSKYRIHGLIKPGAQVLIVDDVSETGRSIEYAIKAVRANGGVVNDALVVIDRSEGAEELAESNGVKLHAFASISELASTLKTNMMLSDEEAELIETKPV